jgi:hypothetical protein
MRSTSKFEEPVRGEGIEDGGGDERAAFKRSRVSLRAARMSLAEEPPLKRCSRGEERELEAQAGGWYRRGGGERRLGFVQPKLAVRDARSSFGFVLGLSMGTGL